MKKFLVCVLLSFSCALAQDLDEDMPQRFIQKIMAPAHKLPEDVIVSTVKQAVASNKSLLIGRSIMSGVASALLFSAILTWGYLYGLQDGRAAFAVAGFTMGSLTAAMLAARNYYDAQWLREIQRLLDVPEMGKLILKILHYSYEHEVDQGHMTV